MEIFTQINNYIIPKVRSIVLTSFSNSILMKTFMQEVLDGKKGQEEKKFLEMMMLLSKTQNMVSFKSGK